MSLRYMLNGCTPKAHTINDVLEKTPYNTLNRMTGMFPLEGSQSANTLPPANTAEGTITGSLSEHMSTLGIPVCTGDSHSEAVT